MGGGKKKTFYLFLFLFYICYENKRVEKRKVLEEKIRVRVTLLVLRKREKSAEVKNNKKREIKQSADQVCPGT